MTDSQQGDTLTPPPVPESRAGAMAADLLRQGAELHRQGALPEATALYREVLELEPSNAEAWHLLGVVAGDLGRSDMAVELLQQAVALEAGDMRYHNNLGNALRARGRLPEATECFRRASALAPTSVEVLTNLGVALQESGDWDAGVECFQAALRLKPHYPDANYTLGNAYRQRGDLEGAVGSYRRALAFRPDYADAHFNLGLVLQQQGDLKGATARFRRVVELLPSDGRACYFLARALQAEGELDEAITTYLRAVELGNEAAEVYYDLGTALSARAYRPAAVESYRQALVRKPDFVDALVNLGTLLHEEGRFSESEGSLRQALAVNPELPEAHLNLGNTLLEMDRTEEALECYRAALRLRPGYAEAGSNLGNILDDIGQRAEALGCHREALASRPDLAEAHWNFALTLLNQGQLSEGWREHEWRWKKASFPSQRYQRAEPYWAGEPLAGRRILVWREQGIGDEIMFASCLPDLIASAAGVIFAATPRLVPLFQRSFPSARIISSDDLEAAPDLEADLQLPIGSLPRFLRHDLGAFPDRAGYLMAEPGRVAYWRDRLDRLGPGLKVGVSWRSKLMSLERRKFYSRLEEWGPILGVPGTRFINLQYDDCSAEIAAAGGLVQELKDLDLFNDLDEVAAMMSALDLVIAPDNSVGEMAAALGRPVWRLDSGRDWSTLGTAHRPWQPSMRLFRRGPTRDWSAVIAEMGEALAELAGSGVER